MKKTLNDYDFRFFLYIRCDDCYVLHITEISFKTKNPSVGGIILEP